MGNTSTPHTSVDSAAEIGVGTSFGFFVRVMAGARIGDGCHISDHVTIEAGSVLGNRVTVQSGVFVRTGIRIGDDVFIGANVCFPADPGIGTSATTATASETILEAGATIAGNSTILPGVRIGQGATVTAGSVVTRSVPPNAIVVGNPAQITGYVTNSDTRTRGTPLNPSIYPEPKEVRHQAYPTSIPGVYRHSFPRIQDLRGDLSVGEFPKNIPFQPLRYFLVFNVQNSEIRGEHAHKKCQQFLVCVAGSCRVVADDGRHREEFLLNSPTKGLYLPAMIWATQYKYTIDGVLLVFASEYYDPQDYIRDYREFLNLALK